MKVALEARALAAPGGGVKTYVENLLRELKAVSEVSVEEFTERPTVDLLLPWWLEVQVPQKIKELRPDIVHFTKAAVSHRLKEKTVVTIYDLIPVLLPESQRWYGRLMWPAALKRAANLSDHIITISEASKQDMVKLLGVSPGKITVTSLAVDVSKFNPSARNDSERVADKYGIKRPYVLYVGTIEPRKNVPALVRAFARIAAAVPHGLVIAGRHYKGWDLVQYEIEKAGLKDRTTVIDFVEDADLPALYSGADLMAWPSIYEGWGLPPQEAMACGTPVLVSNGGALPEVVGQAGEVVPFSVDRIRERLSDGDFEIRFSWAMADVLNNKEKRDQMSEAGLARVARYTWKSVAEKTVEVYKNIWERN